jgi:hypothetical protein
VLIETSGDYNNDFAQVNQKVRAAADDSRAASFLSRLETLPAFL